MRGGFFLNFWNKKELIVEDKNKIKEYIQHKPLSYGKRFYLSEFLAEKFIKFVAFLSIGIIVAIFYFVFNESKYAFDKFLINEEGLAGETKRTEQVLTQEENLQPESYSAGETEKPESYKPEEYKPESYTSDAKTESNELKPETYKPEEYKPEEYKPESYTSNEPEKPTENHQTKASEETIVSNQAAENTEIKASPIEPVLDDSHYSSYSVKDFIIANDTIEGKPSYIWQPISEKPKYNVLPLFVGSFKLTVIGVAIAAPIAILAALFTSMFAPRRLKEIIKPAIEVLAGFPSVVIGFFCLITLASILQNFFNTSFRLNAFVGGVGIALAVIPIIYTITEDSLAAVPKHLKEASLAMGASLWQTAYRVILPAAIPGVFAAVILGFGRAFGETMIALMATGNAALLSANIFEPIRTMSATVGAEMAEVEYHGVHYGILFLIGSFLFVFTFTLNALAEFYVRKKLIKKFTGK